MIHIPTIEEIDLRIDKFVAGREAELSRSAIQKYIESGYIKVNGKNIQKSYKIKAEDEVLIIVPDVTEISIEAQNIPIEIIYEDSDLLVVNKLLLAYLNLDHLLLIKYLTCLPLAFTYLFITYIYHFRI